MSRMRLLLVVTLAALTLGSCAYLGGPVTPFRPPAYYPPSPEGLIGLPLGSYLYARDCAFCHGNRGYGTERGPALHTWPNGAALTDFMLRTGRMPIGHEREPTRHKEPVYNEEEIVAVVAFVETQFDPPGPDIPQVDPASGDIAVGQQLYQLHCAACHATTGIGGAMLTQRGEETIGGTTGIIIPPLDDSPPVEVAEAVRTGPGTMPVFGREVMNDHELNSLLQYVAFLQTPPDPGGAGIGHIGPFMEGAVGWVVGLGSLLLFCYWLGTRSGESRERRSAGATREEPS
ncbi:MAG: cytochrome c [Actinomycetota bacterium]|nr:cytochrome c [Actinomycetota bacterium]